MAETDGVIYFGDWTDVGWTEIFETYLVGAWSVFVDSEEGWRVCFAGCAGIKETSDEVAESSWVDIERKKILVDLAKTYYAQNEIFKTGGTMGQKFGGTGGKIDYADMSKKTEHGDRAGQGTANGNKTRTEGIGTTSKGDIGAGHVKDDSFQHVADQSGWGRGK
jgi:hypothetical protein